MARIGQLLEGTAGTGVADQVQKAVRDFLAAFRLVPKTEFEEHLGELQDLQAEVEELSRAHPGSRAAGRLNAPAPSSASAALGGSTPAGIAVRTRAQVGMASPLVTVEAHIGGGLPRFTLVGLPEAAVREARDRVRSALENNGFAFPDGRVVVNLAPADLAKQGARFDLAIALSLLAASGQVPAEHLCRFEFPGGTGPLRRIAPHPRGSAGGPGARRSRHGAGCSGSQSARGRAGQRPRAGAVPHPGRGGCSGAQAGGRGAREAYGGRSPRDGCDGFPGPGQGPRDRQKGTADRCCGGPSLSHGRAAGNRQDHAGAERRQPAARTHRSTGPGGGGGVFQRGPSAGPLRGGSVSRSPSFGERGIHCRRRPRGDARGSVPGSSRRPVPRRNAAFSAGGAQSAAGTAGVPPGHHRPRQLPGRLPGPGFN